MVSREVDVNRPEHSWIPFYRELAEKLVKDGWRERQGELVGMLQRMQANGVPMPRMVEYMRDLIDPFTVFALFSRDLRFDNTLRVMRGFKDAFNLIAELPRERPFIPYADNRSIGYFSRFVDIDAEINVMWDLFEIVVMTEHFDDISGNDFLIRLINEGLNIRGIAISKLTSAFYWVNPYRFLHSDTVNAVGGKSLGIRATDGESYLKTLERTREITSQTFPDINVVVWKGEEVTWLEDSSDRPDVWIMRGGRDAHAVGTFLERGYAGIGFNLENDDLSVLSSADEIRDLYQERNPRGTASNQVIDFRLKVKPGDYVLMPSKGSSFNHFGRFTSNVFNDGLGPYMNKRSVDWYERTISRDEIDLSNYQRTLLHPNSSIRDRFFDIIKDSSVVELRVARPIFKMPEDSWVPFHLEVGRKLVEGEWWREDKREDLVDLIQRLREADPAGTTASNETFDSFNFYQAFCQRQSGQDRMRCFEILNDELGLDADLPDPSAAIWNIDAGWRIEESLDGDRLESLWDVFRAAVETDPASDEGCHDDFASKFDRAHESSRPHRWPRILSTWLYLIDPTKFVHINRLERLGILEDLGLDDIGDGEDGEGANYVRALVRAQELATRVGLTLLDLNRESMTDEMLGLDSKPAPEVYTVDDVLREGVFLERDHLVRMERILRTKKNMVLQGPPGVGKTFIARKLAYVLMGAKAEDRVTSVQFHQSYSYEDFVGGFRPDVMDSQMVFTRQDGPFLRMCAEARANPDVEYVMLIDEINRGNLSRVFGELLMLIEADKRKPEFGVKLQHRPDDDEGFYVPENVYIIGTMNLADRSLTGMNVAMRRRFGFVDLKPQFNKRVFTDWLARETDMPPEWREWINSKMFDLNQTIARHPSLNENYAVGHSFFCPRERAPEVGWNEWYEAVVEYEIRPLLREYWFDDPDTARTEANKLLRDD